MRQERELPRVFEAARQRLGSAVGKVFPASAFERTVSDAVAGLLRTTNEIVQDTVWRERILRSYRMEGHAVKDFEDVRSLDLEAVDRAVEGLAAKYGSASAVQGAAAGFAGIAGIVPDIVGLVALNLRAAGEYASYCGYDIAEDAERLYAFQILNHVTDTGRCPAEPGLVPADSISRRAASRHSRQAFRQLAVAGSAHGISRVLGTRLAKAKLAQLLPAAGALVGGGFNALFTKRVCDAAYCLYLERRLLQKYDAEFLASQYRKLS